MRSSIRLSLALSLSAVVLVGAIGCANSPSAVLAQSNSPYSNASLAGNYAVNFTEAYGYSSGGGGNTYGTDIGTISFDGNGNISGGTINRLFPFALATCTATPTGTYSINSSGAGSASLTFSASGLHPCANGGTHTFSIEAAQQGDVTLWMETDADYLTTGTSAKQ